MTVVVVAVVLYVCGGNGGVFSWKSDFNLEKLLGSRNFF